MKGKERNRKLYSSRDCLQIICNVLSSLHAQYEAQLLISHTSSVDVTLTPRFNHAKVTVSRHAPYVVLQKGKKDKIKITLSSEEEDFPLMLEMENWSHQTP